MFCSMLKTLERYQKCNYGAPETNVSTREALVILNNLTFLILYNHYANCPFNLFLLIK
jgi:hypothetical protein